MANTLRFKRGLASGIPTGVAGEPLFTTDTFDLYIGNGTTNTRFQKYIASGATTQILRGDGSLYTFPLAISSPSNGQVLKYNGTSWVNDSDSGITGSLTTNYLPKATGATTLGNSLLQEGTSAIGLGVTPSSFASATGFQIGYVGSLAGRASGSGIYLSSNAYFIGDPGADGLNARYIQTTTAGSFLVIGNNHYWFTAPSGTLNTAITWTRPMTLYSTGNLAIGSAASDSGQRLQVTGDTLLKGSGNTSATTALTVQNSDGNAIFRVVNDGRLTLTSSNFVGIIPTNAGSNSPEIGGVSLRFLTNTATAAQSNFYFRGVNALSGTSGNQININANETFQPTSGTATFTQIQLGGSINQTGGANGITRGLYVNPTLTAAADWRSIEWSNNTGWGLYGAGAANNYLAGSLGIGTTGLSNTNLSVNKNLTGLTNVYGIFNSGSIRSDVTFGATMFSSSPSIQNAVFTLPGLKHFEAVGISSVGSATITTQFGFFVESTLSGAITNYGFYGNIAAATGRWNLFMDGTANNFMRGSLLVGTSTTSTGEALQVTGTAKITGATGANNLLTFTNGTNTDYLYLDNNGFGLFSGASATGNGFYIRGNNIIDFYINSSIALRLDSTGSLNVGSGSANSTAVLQADSTTKGFLPPRMTNAQRTAISSPAVGLIVYCTDMVEGVYVYKSTGWTFVI